MSQPDPAADATAQSEESTPPADQRAAFKAALDRKKAAAHDRTQHLDGDNRVVGSSHAAATRRVFRRKSG